MTLSFMTNYFSIFPFSFCNFVSFVAMIDSIPIWLAVFEISFPAAILEIYFSCSFAFIFKVISFIFYPVPFVDADIILIDFLLSLRYLQLSILSPIAMKEALLELSFVPQFFIFEV